jgi:hypothetical protein|uniref:Uncharacterized protein n=1 Tax=viral metagenome TaxID=1070528 RepID=A0A6C0JQX4_9ZZZZ
MIGYGQEYLHNLTHTPWFRFFIAILVITTVLFLVLKIGSTYVDIFYLVLDLFKVCLIFGFAFTIYKIATDILRKNIKNKMDKITKTENKYLGLNVFERALVKIMRLWNLIIFGLFFSLLLSNKSIIGPGGILYNLIYYCYNVVIISLVLYFIILSFEFMMQYCVE